MLDNLWASMDDAILLSYSYFTYIYLFLFTETYTNEWDEVKLFIVKLEAKNVGDNLKLSPTNAPLH